MTICKPITMFFAAAALFAAGSAGAIEPGPWALSSPEGTCELSFEREPVADGIWSILQHKGDCPEQLKSLSGYSESNEGQSLMLYSTVNGLEMQGRVDREDANLYVGMVGDHDVTMSR